MPQLIGLIDDTTPVDISVICQSLHVVAYRVWHRRPSVSKDWKVIGTGQTEDDVPDHLQVNAKRDDEIAYWLGIGGTKPNNTYVAVVTVSQGGKLLTGGALVETGTTDADGVAVANDEATFR